MKETMIVQLTVQELEDLIEQSVNRALTNKANITLAPEKDLMNIKEASEFTGFTVGSIYQLVHANKIPYMKVTSRLHFSKKEISEWIASGSQNFYNKSEK